MPFFKGTTMEKELWTFKGHKEIKITVEIGNTWWLRFKGLMGRSRASLPKGEGLFLQHTNSIHMCFMRFAIDAVYFDKNLKIVKIVRHLHPWIGLSACLKADSCLEMRAGEAERIGMKVGMVAEKEE